MFFYLFSTMGWRMYYSDVIMGAVASQITDVSIVCLNVCSGADQRKHQSSASLAFVRGTHRWSVDSPYKGPVTRKMFPLDDVIMECKDPLILLSIPWLLLTWRLKKIGHKQRHGIDRILPEYSGRSIREFNPLYYQDIDSSHEIITAN